MLFTEIALAIVAAAFLFIDALYIRERKWRRYTEYVLREEAKHHNDMMSAHLDLITRYERVQHGYDQGVLEGMRQAYVNVRATLADELFITGGTDGAKLRAFVLPLLENLGTHETKILDEMKGNTKAREAFEKHAGNTEPINMFPGNNKPQIAQPVEDN